MAEEKGMATMNIEDIRTIERFMFWLERAAIFIEVLVGPRYPSSTALLFLITNVVFIALSVERQFIRRFFFEPNAIFYIERLAILLEILHYVVPGGSVYSVVIGMVVLIITNCWMVTRYLVPEEQLPSKDRVSYETNTTQNAEETRMGDHDEEEKAIIKDESLKKKGDSETSQEVVGLFEAFMGGSSNAMETIKDGNLKKEEAAVEDEVLEEKSEVKAKTRNTVDAISECDCVYIKEEVGGRGEELKTEEDESPELQGNNRDISASEDAKTEKDLQEQEQEQWSAVSLTDDFEENEVDLKEKEGENEIESDNQSWEKVQNDLSECLSEAVESSLDQQKTDEVEEAKDEQAATGNYESDGDCGWEVVQNIPSGKLGAEIAPSDQNKADQSEEVEHKEENTSNYNTDESSWEETQNNLSRKSSASISSSEFFQKQMLEHEVNSQEQKDLTELQKQVEEVEVIVEDKLKTKLGLESCNPNAKLHAAMEILVFAQERLKWNKEKERLQAKLDAMTVSLDQERRKWQDEKKELYAKLDAMTESLDQERRKWQDEKKELYAKLDVSLQICETYRANETGFAEGHQKWDEQENALNALISHANENVQYCQTVVNAYNEHCMKLAQELNESRSLFQDSINQLMEETDGLSSSLEAATSSAQCYKAWYIQSEQHCQYYIACLEEYEGKYSKLMEDHLNLESKFYSESLIAEDYMKVAQELEDKCSTLEKEKTYLTAQLRAAKASSELHRARLHDYVASTLY